MTIYITDIQDVTPDLCTRMAEAEYRYVMGMAKAMFDFTCGIAVDMFGHGSKEHHDAIDRARAEYANTQIKAAAYRDSRIKDLRAAIARAA